MNTNTEVLRKMRREWIGETIESPTATEGRLALDAAIAALEAGRSGEAWATNERWQEWLQHAIAQWPEAESALVATAVAMGPPGKITEADIARAFAAAPQQPPPVGGGQPAPVSEPAASGEGPELEQVVMFLLGQDEIRGAYFGEKPEGARGNYWWRVPLRDAWDRYEARRLTTTGQGDVERLVLLARRHEGHDPQLCEALAPFGQQQEGQG